MADIHEMPDRDARADLTARQEKVLRVIKESVDQRGYPPSLREIGTAVQLASPSSVAYQLRMLERKGLGRIAVSSVLLHEGDEVGRFEGEFVALGSSDARRATSVSDAWKP